MNLAICGTGVDLADHRRFQQMLEEGKESFFQRIFTADEREYCERYATPNLKAQHYSARFAAKEAFVKALGTGFRQMGFHDIEVKNDELGAPFLKITGRAAELLTAKGICKVHLSLSHSDSHSIAMVVAEGKE